MGGGREEDRSISSRQTKDGACSWPRVLAYAAARQWSRRPNGGDAWGRANHRPGTGLLCFEAVRHALLTCSLLRDVHVGLMVVCLSSALSPGCDTRSSTLVSTPSEHERPMQIAHQHLLRPVMLLARPGGPPIALLHHVLPQPACCRTLATMNAIHNLSSIQRAPHATATQTMWRRSTSSQREYLETVSKE